jgi:WD40 repeat protein
MVALSVLFSAAAAAETVSLLSTGHKGKVSALEFDRSRSLLFSAGVDGTVRFWGTEDGRLRGMLAISRNAVAGMAVNPVYPYIAVVEDTGSFTARLSVWDWTRKEPVFSESLPEEPLFLRWSSSGNMLLFGQSAWDSLRMLRTGDWTPVASAVEGGGIVGFAELSRNENTLMSYSPVGRISYQSMADGSLIQESKTVAYLDALRLTGDRRYLVGATDRELVVADAVSGEVSAHAPISRIRSVDVSPEGDRIACVVQAEERTELVLYSRSDWGLYRSFLPREVGDIEIDDACFGNGLLYAAGSDGTIWSVSEEGSASPFVRDETPDFIGMDLQGDRLALSCAENILVLRSPYLSARAPGSLPSSVTLDSFPNPFSADADLLFLEDGRLLLWRKGMESGATAILDPLTGRLESGPSFPEELSTVKCLDGRILTVEKGGRIRLTDLSTQAAVFEAMDPGMNAAIFLGSEVFVGGRSSHEQGALVRIDARTGETVGIPDGNRFVFSVAADPAGREVFSLGVDQDGGTRLSLRQGAQLENETILDRIPEEDAGAAMTVDPKGNLFFLLGTERIRTWDGKRTAALASSGRIGRSLVAASGLVLALNADCTISLWDAANGEVLCNLGLFRDGAWAATLQNGFYLSTKTVEPRIRTLIDGIPLEDNSAYRIELPSEP